MYASRVLNWPISLKRTLGAGEYARTQHFASVTQRSQLRRWAKSPVPEQKRQVKRPDLEVGVGVEAEHKRVRDVWTPVPEQKRQIKCPRVVAVIHVRGARLAFNRESEELVGAGVNWLFARAPVAEEEGEVGGADGAVGVEVGGVVGVRAPIAQEIG